MNKNNYVIHYRNLQQCLEKGLKLKKVRRILKFKQKVWMKPYIDFNTDKRKEATNESDKNFLKLFNNALYDNLQYFLTVCTSFYDLIVHIYYLFETIILLTWKLLLSEIIILLTHIYLS